MNSYVSVDLFSWQIRKHRAIDLDYYQIQLDRMDEIGVWGSQQPEQTHIQEAQQMLQHSKYLMIILFLKL